MAQEQLNDYKYVIVPKKFDAFKRENQHQTSTLTKYLFTEKGFLTVYEDQIPDELNNNRCLGLLVDLIDDSSLFTTKTGLTLEDCQGKEVFATKQGKSKEKDYKASFGEALREAFTSFDILNYSYNGKAGDSEPVTVSFENDVKKIDESKEQKPTSAKNQDAMVQQEATLENQSYKDNSPKPSDIKKSEPVTNKIPSISIAMLSGAALYAQELPNGYQLVDSTPKIQLRIYKSSLPNYYLAKAGDKNGVVFEKNGKWFFEYYSGENLMTEELDIKF